MIPQFPPYYVKCPSCGVFFKLSNDVVIGSIPFGCLDDPSMKEYPDEWMNAPRVEFLTIDELRQAIRKGLCNSGAKGSKEWKKDIRALRFELWEKFIPNVIKRWLWPF